jgi:hypothetical protein
MVLCYYCLYSIFSGIISISQCFSAHQRGALLHWQTWFACLTNLFVGAETPLKFLSQLNAVQCNASSLCLKRLYQQNSIQATVVLRVICDFCNPLVPRLQEPQPRKNLRAYLPHTTFPPAVTSPNSDTLTSIMVPLVSTPSCVYKGFCGFFFTLMMGS